MKKRYLSILILAGLLSACGSESTSDPVTAPAEPAFSGSKSDEASCSTSDQVIADEEITQVTVQSECGTTWFSRGGRFAREVEFLANVYKPSTVDTRLAGVCIQKLEYTRFYGLNPDHPVLAGWQEDTVSDDYDNLPCEWFEIKDDGSLVSLDDGSSVDAILEAGWYDIGFSVPDDFRGGEVTFDVFAGALETEDTCGDGIVDPQNEFCDDGNDSPMDACGLDCFWNKGFFSEVADNNLPEQAVSLEGFQQVYIDNIFRGEDDADWFAYIAPQAGDLVLRNARGEDTLLTIYEAGEPDVAVDSVVISECGERCSLAVPEAGEYLIEFWRAETGATYKVDVEGTNVN